MKAHITLTTAMMLAALPGMPLAQDKADDFLKKTIEDNLAEIEAGNLAQKQASSDAVKAFARQLVADHSAANDEAVALAKSLGVSVPDAPGGSEQLVLDRLEKLEGAEFDKVFATEMVKDHQKTIDDFEKQAGGTGPAADFAKKTLPVLKTHLEAAKELESGT